MSNAYEHECQDDDTRYLQPPRIYAVGAIPANDNDWEDDPLPLWVPTVLATVAVVFAVFMGIVLAQVAEGAPMIIRAVM